MGCGICGFVGLSDRELLRSMCEVGRHRGPDSTGFYVDKGVGLGINRLKVIDLVKGDQPVHNEDETVWTVFNGEIYNYRELRRELESAGHRFYTDSDTETIVHSYEQWGRSCVQHMRGMFAFAVWDSKAKALLLARDRFGKKPLYYSMVDGALLFASEIKSLLEAERVEREIDREALDHYFTYMYIPAPFTIFKGVRKLPAGSTAVFQGGVLDISGYWDMSYRPEGSMTEDEAVESLYETIEEAVRVRMRSDVPLGAFLSGGIDSSTVVSFMSRLSERPVKTVSIGFDEGESELPYSRLVAEALKTDHHEFIVTPDTHRILPELVWHFDEPFADHSMIPTYYLSQVARREVTVALSGDGGDEMFVGYPFMSDPPSYSAYSRVPRGLRRPLLSIAKSLPFDGQFKRAATHAYDKGYGDQAYDERYAMRVSLYDPAGLKSLYSKEALKGRNPVDTYSIVRSFAANSKTTDELSSLDYVTIRTYLTDDILVKVDRMSMAVSLEVRCPLLDQAVADLAGRIPSRMKLNGTTTKYIFKKMVVKKGLLPPEIANRKKQGFGAPIEPWTREDWMEVVTSILDPVLTGRLKLIDKSAVRKLLDDPYVNSNKLFALMTYVIWHGIYVENEGKRPAAAPDLTA